MPDCSAESQDRNCRSNEHSLTAGHQTRLQSSWAESSSAVNPGDFGRVDQKVVVQPKALKYIGRRLMRSSPQAVSDEIVTRMAVPLLPSSLRPESH
ncbi:hypothetical protein RRG08_054530 [Elysia crispata]|uniref:Uncharacterized protein n=1 Tax=Elysia crispata TaxID=231223 RepID=A0AAE1B9P1_9GAST|nr:hypothetical protein RRG08_054530 [Elysia crispata]